MEDGIITNYTEKVIYFFIEWFFLDTRICRKGLSIPLYSHNSPNPALHNMTVIIEQATRKHTVS